jgi:YgiT-type zinc finger domain-containing protein
MKRKKSPYDYGECHVCGEKMEERYITQDFWQKDQLVVIEDVLAGVCPQCGEKVVKADIGRLIATLFEDAKRLQKARTMSVPVLSFTKELGV